MARTLVDYEYKDGDFAVLVWDDPDNEFEYDTEVVELKDVLEYLMEYSNQLRNITETVQDAGHMVSFWDANDEEDDDES